MTKSKYLHLFFFNICIVSIICLLDNIAGEEREVHIVYMGSLPQGEYLSGSHHISLLQAIGHSKNMIKKTLVRSYTRSFNGFTVYLTSEEASKLKSMVEVVSVFKSQKYQTATTRSWDYIGLTLDIPRNHAIESDIIIGHIDSGVNHEAKSFSDHNLGHVPSKWKGVCCGGKNFICNRKLIGARYYVGDTATDLDDHGTLTASIAVGRVVKNANFFGIANGTARGGVPSARIATYKVCEGKCVNEDIMAAFDDAIADNVDIITISLVSGRPVKISEDVIAIGSFHAMEKGILTIQAAGNAGNELFTVSSIAPWLFTVAASSIDRKIITKLVLGNGRTIIVSINLFICSHNKMLVYGREITNHCNESNAKKCMVECIDPPLVKGRIILCDDDGSDALFKLVAINASASGIIYRLNEAYVDDIEAQPFPVVYLNDFDFHYVESYHKFGKLASARIFRSETIHNNIAPIVAFFSSRGPNMIIPGIFKPDITAPGVVILAESPKDTNISIGQVGAKYNFDSGTSVSCPHVAGAIAYVKSKHPDWSVSAIKSSLMTTAWTMNIKYNADVELGYGAGHINPVKATHPGLVYETFIHEYINMFCNLGSEGYKLRKMLGTRKKCPKGIRTSPNNLNYPAMTALVHSNSTFSIQFRRVVTNVGHSNSTYHAQISTSDSMIYINVEPSVMSFVNLKERKKFVVTVSGQWLNQDYVSSSLVWFDGIHRVRSPILLYRSSLI
ncbi:subtilisin-like protease SBT4.3 [Impatiens glandulifera]|uniref:subtilisin-like protease SBT4.3 n=1 Tax=Impatiens glandulifera TaxID=253017 RepID=UPI001FB06328|nr:subtilisin-like protease SBT4.3 [Impatiens glandulifera]